MEIKLQVITDNGNIYNINRTIPLSCLEQTKTPDKLFEYHMDCIVSEVIESIDYIKEN